MPSAPTTTAVRTFLRALQTGDRDLLASVALPHPDLALLLPAPPQRAADPPATAQLTALDLPGERQLVHVLHGQTQHLLVVHATPFGPRLDLRHLIAARLPDDARRATARAFYRGLLRGDLQALRALAFDTAGIEALGAEDGQPSLLDVEPAVQALGLCELGVSEAFTVPNGVQFVSARHHELGICVLAGFTPTGEIPFLLRQRDGAWKVIALHFQQAAAQERAAAGTQRGW